VGLIFTGGYDPGYPGELEVTAEGDGLLRDTGGELGQVGQRQVGADGIDPAT
jgi:hypothetical protein